MEKQTMTRIEIIEYTIRSKWGWYGSTCIKEDAEELRADLDPSGGHVYIETKAIDLWEYAAQNIMNITPAEIKAMKELLPEEERTEFNSYINENYEQTVG